MPKQRVLFGMPISTRLLPRRLPFLLVSIVLFISLTLLLTVRGLTTTTTSTTATASTPSSSSLSSFRRPKVSIPKLSVPFSASILNPFRAATHAPAVQKNSTYDGSSWYSNWNWLSPFSSSVTLDENRALLPPMRQRPPIYTYYDTTVQRDAATKEAESALLLTWRRAWWAQGFRPIILSAGEAMNNPLYDELQRLEVEPVLKTDMMRLLAWENMGGGLLASYLLLPMGPYNDALLSHLRRGELLPRLTRWEGLGDGLFAGRKTEITSVITNAMRSPEKTEKKKAARSFLEAVPADALQVDKTSDGIALYNERSLERYAPLAREIGANRAAGLTSLNKLMNSHLHLTWQNTFTGGIACLKPLPTHTTTMIEPAFELAQWLAQCPDTPLPASCPPNRPKCTPCDGRLKTTTPAHYRNTTKVYTIGTVPHPYLLTTLHTFNDSIDVAFVRRKTARDVWLSELTRAALGQHVSGYVRIVGFKEAVAGERAAADSIWLAAEQRQLPDDLDWHFGFSIPVNGSATDRARMPKHNAKDGRRPTAQELAHEPDLILKAEEVRKSKKEADVRIRDAVEAWNLADTEAWRFARAFLARARVERLKWEEEESKYAGGAGSDKGGKRAWARWRE